MSSFLCSLRVAIAGIAGGSPHVAGAPAAGVHYFNTTHAVQGDAGSKVLPPRPTGTVWTAGDLVEVSWTLRTNHGGGYQYRISSASEPLTEANFQKTPLPFATKQSVLRWNGIYSFSHQRLENGGFFFSALAVGIMIGFENSLFGPSGGSDFSVLFLASHLIAIKIVAS